MRKALLGLSFTFLILALLAIGPDAPADDPGPAAQEPQSAETEAPGTEATGEPELEGPPGGEPLETFEPTEKLAADSAVSFPVDI